MEIFEQCNAEECTAIATYSCACTEPSLKLCEPHFGEHSNAHTTAQITRLVFTLPAPSLEVLSQSMARLSQSTRSLWYQSSYPLEAKASTQIIKYLDAITQFRAIPKNSLVPFIQDLEKLALHRALSKPQVTQAIHSATDEYTKCAQLTETIESGLTETERIVGSIERLNSAWLILLDQCEQAKLKAALSKYRRLADRSAVAILRLIEASSVSVWLESGEPLDCKAVVNCVVVSPCGQKVVAGSDKGDLFVWQHRQHKFNHLKGIHQSIVNAVAVAPTQLCCASGCNNGYICLTNLSTLSVQTRLHGPSAVSCVNYSQSGKFLVAAHHERAITIWDATNGELLHSLNAHEKVVTAVSFTWHENELVSGSEDKSIVVWSGIASDVNRQRLKKTLGAVCAVAVAPKKRLIAAAGEESRVSVWNFLQESTYSTMTKRNSKRLDADDTGCNSVVFSPDEEYIAASSNSGNIFVWATETLHLVQKLKVSDKPLFGVAFTPDNTQIISAGKEGLVRCTAMNSEGFPTKRVKFSP